MTNLRLELSKLPAALLMQQKIVMAFNECQWVPHKKYSVFNQPDKDFYLGAKDGFIKKYQVFWSVARACLPHSIIELGCNAGSATDAFLDACDGDCTYTGYDVFGYDPKWGEYNPWNYIHELLKERKHERATIIKQDLRTVQSLAPADFVFVDAAHEYRNERADLELALTANPKWIYVDDYIGPDCARAVRDFIADHKDRVEWLIELKHLCDSVLMGIKQ